MNVMLGKYFNTWHFEIFFLIHERSFDIMAFLQFVSKEEIYMKYQRIFSGKNKKYITIINLLSPKFDHKVVRPNKKLCVC